MLLRPDLPYTHATTICQLGDQRRGRVDHRLGRCRSIASVRRAKSEESAPCLPSVNMWTSRMKKMVEMRRSIQTKETSPPDKFRHPKEMVINQVTSRDDLSQCLGLTTLARHYVPNAYHWTARENYSFDRFCVSEGMQTGLEICILK